MKADVKLVFSPSLDRRNLIMKVEWMNVPSNVYARLSRIIYKKFL